MNIQVSLESIYLSTVNPSWVISPVLSEFLFSGKSLLLPVIHMVIRIAVCFLKYDFAPWLQVTQGRLIILN